MVWGCVTLTPNAMVKNLYTLKRLGLITHDSTFGWKRIITELTIKYFFTMNSLCVLNKLVFSIYLFNFASKLNNFHLSPSRVQLYIKELWCARSLQTESINNEGRGCFWIQKITRAIFQQIWSIIYQNVLI